MALLEVFQKARHWIRHRHPHQLGSPILRANDLSVRYESGAALEDVSFELKIGERLAVVGPNGAGKSTLFKVIAGVLTPTKGQVHVYGHEPGGHICIAYIPQRSQVDWDFPVTVSEVVMMGRIGKLGFFRQPKARDWEVVQHSLDVVAMSHLSKRQIDELSGGQQQRMFIAQALAQEAELMLMDEPLSGLDLSSKEDIFQILDELRQREVTVLVAMHDLKMASESFDRVMLLNRRLVGLGDPSAVLTPDQLMRAYGDHLHLLTSDEGVLALGDTCCDEGVEAM